MHNVVIVQLAVTSMQQIFRVRVALDLLRHNEVNKIYAFYAKVFSFLNFSWSSDSNVS